MAAQPSPQLVALLLLLLLQVAVVSSDWVFCVIPGKGMAACDPTVSSQTYSGYDVDLIRWLMNRIGITETYVAGTNASVALATNAAATQQFRLVCTTNVGFAGMATLLSRNDTVDTCAGGLGGFSVTQARIAAGLTYSYPYKKSGLGIVIWKSQETTDKFAFLKPFALDTWLAFVFTIFVVPMLAWVVERLSVDGVIPFGWSSLHSLRQATYQTMLAVYNLQVYQVTSFPAQIVIYTFGFMVLITISTYTSQLSAQFTLNSIQSNINSIHDLSGQPVATHSAYMQRLTADYSRTFSDIEWTGQAAFDQAIAALANGTIVAYLMNKVLLDPYVTAINQAGVCQLGYAAQIPEEPFDLAIAWNTLMPFDIMNRVNKALVAAQETGWLGVLDSKYLTPGTNPCDAGLGGNTRVKFAQLAGLWVILGSAVAVALLWVLVDISIRIFNSYRQMNVDEEGLEKSSRSAKMKSLVSQLVMHEDTLQQKQLDHTMSMASMAEASMVKCRSMGRRNSTFSARDGSQKGGKGAVSHGASRTASGDLNTAIQHFDANVHVEPRGPKSRHHSVEIVPPVVMTEVEFLSTSGGESGKHEASPAARPMAEGVEWWPCSTAFRNASTRPSPAAASDMLTVSASDISKLAAVIDKTRQESADDIGRLAASIEQSRQEMHVLRELLGVRRTAAVSVLGGVDDPHASPTPFSSSDIRRLAATLDGMYQP